eukprot:1013330-Ditylum_brightwellii.AAC.1
MYGSNWTNLISTALNVKKGKKRKRKGSEPSLLDLLELTRDVTTRQEVVVRSTQATWREWKGGSTLVFWRWTPKFCQEARDGSPAFIVNELLPSFWQRPRLTKDVDNREQLKSKISKVVQRQYIEPGAVKSITGFSDMPKGAHDIRVIYDASACGLNSALWAPNFSLPTTETVARAIDGNTWLADIDISEMFHNYWLDKKVRPYAGVDLTILGNEGNLKRWRWARLMMGLTDSPFLSIKAFLWGEEIIHGNRHKKDNPLHWDQVQLNLPRSSIYNPTIAWVRKVNLLLSCVANDFVAFYDDVRLTGNLREACIVVMRCVGLLLNHLGQQEAAQKTRPPIERIPGAWAGKIFCTDPKLGLF